MQKYLSGSLFLLFLFSTPVLAGGHTIAPTVSYLKWNTLDYSVQGEDFHMESTDNSYGVLYRYTFDSGLSIGPDLSFHVRDFVAQDSSFTGYANIRNIMGYVGYVFNREGRVQPYLEAGVGQTWISLHSGGGPNATLHGIDTTYGVGMNIKFSRRLGMRLDAKRINFDVEDKNNAAMEGDMNAISASLNITF